MRRKNALDAKFEGYLSYMYTYVENKMIKVTKRLGIKRVRILKIRSRNWQTH